ncbi:GDSL-type esterase/lipase family protein [Paenibacillus hamazuiensis]|uniref:GDSL-type esterase/lipase family protein n=1 Tax=Paenibacillus hamazuiensis TaxID=2936508 RepID=UPI00200E9760|nr:GDSL-type esterase/lipase family protein [Paenibacillus hamazuiensis]
MIHEHVCFHNVEELELRTGMPGWVLQRYPKRVRDRLGEGYDERGRYVASMSTGCEMRFVTSSGRIRITLSAPVEEGDIVVYNGDFFHSLHRLESGKIQTLQLERSDRFAEVPKEALQTGRFSPDVWRIFVSRRYVAGPGFQVAYHHLETFGHPVRPPAPDEVPSVRWLAYGSSITHGSGATVNPNSYIQQAARRLGFDVLNKGLGGSCFCEKETADFFAAHPGWDVATLELGVNMRGFFTTEQFAERAGYLVRSMAAAHPGKPIFLITLFPNSADHHMSKDHAAKKANREFADVLRGLHRELASPNVHLLEGHELLPDFGALAADLIHPSDYGHIVIGENLAKRMKDFLL